MANCRHLLEVVPESPIFRFALLLFLASIFVLGIFTPSATTDDTPSARKDVDLYAAVVSRLEHGIPYYEALGNELRSRGYPTVPVMNWRTPLHLTVLAALSVPRARIVIGLLGVFVLIAVAWALGPRGILAAGTGVLLLLGATPSLHVAVLFSEAWSGVFIVLSITAYARTQWVPAALCGVVSVFFRELAAVFALACGLAAIHARRRPEILVWIVGGAAYLVYYAVHAASAYREMQPGDLTHLHSWIRWQGLPFVYETAKWYGWTSSAPAILAPLVVSAGLAATAAPSMPLQLRLAVLTYVAAFSVIGQPFNSYWGLLTAPVWAFALAYTGEGVRWLSRIEIRNPAPGSTCPAPAVNPPDRALAPPLDKASAGNAQASI